MAVGRLEAKSGPRVNSFRACLSSQAKKDIPRRSMGLPYIVPGGLSGAAVRTGSPLVASVVWDVRCFWNKSLPYLTPTIQCIPCMCMSLFGAKPTAGDWARPGYVGPKTAAGGVKRVGHDP